MQKRVESLETRLIPPSPVESHLIGMMSGETEADARARYGQPIGEDDFVILLVGVEPGTVDEAA